MIVSILIDGLLVIWILGDHLRRHLLQILLHDEFSLVYGTVDLRLTKHAGFLLLYGLAFFKFACKRFESLDKLLVFLFFFG